MGEIVGEMEGQQGAAAIEIVYAKLPVSSHCLTQLG